MKAKVIRHWAQINLRWPPLRTPRHVPRPLRSRAAIIGALGACIIPLAVGVGLMLLAVPFEAERTAALYEVLWSLGLVLALSPFVSIFALLPAYILAFAAMSYGYAGWIVAIGAGIVVASTCFLFFEVQGHPVVIGGIIGSAYGAVFWFCARLSTPQAFIESHA